MKDIHQMITDRIIQQMETSGTNWLKPFASSAGGAFSNAITGHQYRGVNILTCALFGEGQTLYATYKQWQDVGAQVRKGSTGIPIVFFKMLDKTRENTKTGESEDYRIPMARYSMVFGIDQVDNVPPQLQIPAPVDRPAAEKLADVERYVAATGATIYNAPGRAFYSPDRDIISVPGMDQFIGQGAEQQYHYYSTLLHELTHWTGHRSRLDRKKGSAFGSSDYAYEELIAELGAAMQCHTLGITSEPREDHAQYLAGWLQALRNDKKFIFKAAKQADQAAQFIAGLQHDTAQAA